MTISGEEYDAALMVIWRASTSAAEARDMHDGESAAWGTRIALVDIADRMGEANQLAACVALVAACDRGSIMVSR